MGLVMHLPQMASECRTSQGPSSCGPWACGPVDCSPAAVGPTKGSCHLDSEPWGPQAVLWAVGGSWFGVKVWSNVSISVKGCSSSKKVPPGTSLVMIPTAGRLSLQKTWAATPAATTWLPGSLCSYCKRTLRLCWERQRENAREAGKDEALGKYLWGSSSPLDIPAFPENRFSEI